MLNLNKLYSYFIFLIILLTSYGCKDDLKIDEPLSCKITAPSDGDVIFYGDIVTIEVSVNDLDDEISEMELFCDYYKDNIMVQSLTQGVWNTINESEGKHLIKAQVKNSKGEIESDKIEIEIKIERSSFTDSRDGQVYKTVKIGDQWWMAENVNYITTENSWAYNDNDSLAEIYGRLYTYDAAINACPEGWHIPNNSEWSTLRKFLIEGYAGQKLREAGTSHWNSPNDANNLSGFTALPAGQRFYSGDSYRGLGEYTDFWSSTKYDEIFMNTWGLSILGSNLSNGTSSIYFGHSLRCIKNE